MKKTTAALIAKIIMIIWFVVIMIGLIVGRNTNTVSGGEFIIGLMFWVYLSWWFNDHFRY